jgi:hypothetical protein
VSVSKSSEGESHLVLTAVLSLLCCILFALRKGGPTSIPAGTVLQAFTTMPVELKKAK